MFEDLLRTMNYCVLITFLWEKIKYVTRISYRSSNLKSNARAKKFLYQKLWTPLYDTVSTSVYFLLPQPGAHRMKFDFSVKVTCTSRTLLPSFSYLVSSSSFLFSSAISYFSPLGFYAKITLSEGYILLKFLILSNKSNDYINSLSRESSFSKKFYSSPTQLN